MKKFLRNNAKVPQLPGVTAGENWIEFDDRYTSESIAAIRKKIKSGGYTNTYYKKKAYEPTEDDRQLVLNMIEGKDLDGFLFYECVAANTELDRDGDVLTEAFLQWMSSKYNEGRTIVDGHDRMQRVGKTFKSIVEGGELKVWFYIPPGATMANGDKAAFQLQNGLVERVSVTFRANYKYIPIEESDIGRDYLLYDMPQDEIMAEVRDLALVTMGAQANAVIKEMGENEPSKENPTFGVKEIHETMELKPKLFKEVDKTLNIPEEEMSAAGSIETAYNNLLKEKNDKIANLEAELKPFKEAQEKTLEDKVKQLVNLKKTVLGDKVDAEKETEFAKTLSLDALDIQISQFEELADPDKSKIDTKKPREKKASGFPQSYV